ncbi:MAG: nicotinate phosphoribosyltransferase [Candidatus Thorarchaeota archaeon]|jgi:nicotinate phosphoribosyltransferase
MDRKWRIALEDEILSGKTTDIYFERAVQILEAEGLNPIVHAEATVSGMPKGFEWGIVAGVNDALRLFEGKNVDIFGLHEGTYFRPRDPKGVKTPVFAIEGPYQEFATLETPLLGFLCHTSGMATQTAHVRLAAGKKSLLSFGARRTHPAITPQVEYAAFIGGCDGVSCILGAEMLGVEPQGTMPHALIIAAGDHIKAWQAYEKHLPKDIPRIALTDTYLDEVVESVLAAESVDSLEGVRLDTTSSRKGNFARIIQEVRWELDIRGYKHIKIYVSGGLDVDSILALREAPVDGFGVGGAISNSPAIDFAMDIVMKKENGKWTPCAKRGKFSGRKTLWRCTSCHEDHVTLVDDAPSTCSCGKKMEKMTTQLMKKGKILHQALNPKAIRENVMKQIKRLES